MQPTQGSISQVRFFCVPLAECMLLTLEPTSRLLMRSLLTWLSAMSALSSASSSSCCSLRNFPRWTFACSSCWSRWRSEKVTRWKRKGEGWRSLFFHTYSFLCRSLVGFNFQLKLINQVLKSSNILAVLLSLLEIQDEVLRSISFVKLPHMQIHCEQHQTNLIGEFFDTALIFTNTLHSFTAFLLFHLHLIF